MCLFLDQRAGNVGKFCAVRTRTPSKSCFGWSDIELAPPHVGGSEISQDLLPVLPLWDGSLHIEESVKTPRTVRIRV